MGVTPLATAPNKRLLPWTLLHGLDVEIYGSIYIINGSSLCWDDVLKNSWKQTYLAMVMGTCRVHGIP